MDTIDTKRDILEKPVHGFIQQAHRVSTRGSPDLPDIQSQPDLTTQSAVALLEDTLSGIEFGMALMDEDLNFVLFNEKYAELSFDAEHHPKIGENAADLALEQLSAGLYVLPDGLDPSRMRDAMVEAVTSCQPDIRLERTDGRMLSASAKRTQLGGYLVTVTDITDRIRAEEAERRRMDTIATIVGALDEGFALWDDDMRFVMCNDQYMKDVAAYRDTPFEVGMTAQQALRDAYTSGTFVIPDGVTLEDFSEQFVSMVRDYAKGVEIGFKDGRTVVATSKRTELGGYLVTTRDVTAERNSEERARALVYDAMESLEEGFALWDSDWRFVMCNQKHIDIVVPYRDTPFEVGTHASDIIREAVAAGIYVMPDGVSEEEFMARFDAWTQQFGNSIDLQFTDGRTVVITPHRTDLGGFLLTSVDVTEERNTEAKARTLVYDAMESLEEGFSLWDKDLNFQMCNQKYMDIIMPFRDEPFPPGTPAREVNRELFRTGYIVLPEGISEDDFVDDLYEWSKSCNGSREFQSTDGRTAVINIHPTSLGGYLVTALDVTKERNSEERARNMLLDAFQALDEGLVLCDGDMNYLFGNDAWKKMMFGDQQQNAPQPGDSVIDNLVQHVRSGFYSIPEGMTQDEYIAWMMGEMAYNGKQVPYSSADGRHFLGSSHSTAFGGSLLFVRDVTKQHDAEENRLAAVNDALDAVDDPLALFSAGRRFVLGNKAWKDMVQGFGDPEPDDTADTLFARLLENGFYSLPEGTSAQTYMEEGLRAMDDLATDYPLSLADGTEQLANVRKTGLDGFLISYRDVTDQIALEEELSQQREIAFQNEKLSALGELLAGVAHELNNPLSVVFGYSQMLQGKIDDPVLSERVDLICQSSERAAKIVRTFLAMARQRPANMNLCDLNDVVETALEVSSYSLKSSGTQVSVVLDQAMPKVMGDFDQLAQVFSNLIVNAGHAVAHKGSRGQISLKTRLKNDRVEVEVADNGHGIPIDVQSRIFEPFFTTKEVGEGTGIGLAFSHRIVESHDGRLTLKSAPGQGTQFFVTLARARDIETQKEPSLVVQSGLQTALVVDDEQGVARLISDMLIEEGFKVTTETNPRAALHIADQQEFDVILSDFKMPEMTGDVFYRALRAISPRNAERIGFITGDALSSDVSSFLAASQRPHIEKPILKLELLELIARATGKV